MRIIQLLCASLLLIAPLALAQGTYTEIDFPGSSHTIPVAINTAGDVVGTYMNANGAFTGFLLSGGTYSTIAYPGNNSTYLEGINDQGRIVGEGYDPYSGFVYDIDKSSFATINKPNADYTFPYAINNAGTIAGQVSSGRFGIPDGFELQDSEYQFIIPPHTHASIVFGVSENGTLYGLTISASDERENFVYRKGQYFQITIPNAPGYQIQGVNPQGTALVGGYNPSPEITTGFVYQNQALTNLEFPGSADYTYANGINTKGEVVGTFMDSAGNLHGFTWTP